MFQGVRMDINRRTLLGNATAATATVMVGKVMGVFGIGPALAGLDASRPCNWHPLTRSLLERAQRIGRDCYAPDRAMAERAIRRSPTLRAGPNPLL
jgi:hypothetical protein